jgi:hypothetical protein
MSQWNTIAALAQTGYQTPITIPQVSDPQNWCLSLGRNQANQIVFQWRTTLPTIDATMAGYVPTVDVTNGQAQITWKLPGTELSHQSLTNLCGGTDGQFYHVNSAQAAWVSDAAATGVKISDLNQRLTAVENVITSFQNLPILGPGVLVSTGSSWNDLHFVQGTTAGQVLTCTPAAQSGWSVATPTDPDSAGVSETLVLDDPRLPSTATDGDHLAWSQQGQRWETVPSRVVPVLNTSVSLTLPATSTVKVYRATHPTDPVRITLPNQTNTPLDVGTFVTLVRAGAGSALFTAEPGVQLVYRTGYSTYVDFVAGRAYAHKVDTNVWDIWGDLATSAV